MAGFRVACLCIALLLASAAGARADWNPGPARYGVGTESNVPVRMSDGVTLQADVYRPTGGAPGERFPVIVSMTPYRKGLSASLIDPQHDLVTHGYIHVIVETRGTGSSQGRAEVFSEREQEDGPEVVRWAASLPGSNGTLGLYGQSYAAESQMFTAARLGPDSPVKAMMPVSTVSDFYREGAAPGGIPSAVLAGFFYGSSPVLGALPPENLADDPLGALTDEASRVTASIQAGAPVLGDLLVTGGDARYDEAYWQARRPGAGLAQIARNHIAVMLVGGWADLADRGETANYAGLQNAAVGRDPAGPMSADQRPSPRFSLIQGPWYHINGALLQTSNTPNALRFFATWLKGQDTGLRDATAPLHLFEQGSDRWVDTGRWPIRGARVRTLYLGAGRTGSVASLNDGRLSTQRPTAATGEDGQTHSAVPAQCSRAAAQYTLGLEAAAAAYTGTQDHDIDPCLKDERPLAPMSLTYTSAPFGRDTSVAGPITATLYQRSDAPDSEQVLTLQDVAPDGSARPFTTGYQMGSFRANDRSRSWFVDGKLVRPWHPFTRASRTPLPLGAVQRVDVEVNPTLARLRRGHRLRLAITTNVAPALTPTPTEQLQLGTLWVQRTRRFASHVNVPTIASDRLRTSPVSWGGCQGSC